MVYLSITSERVYVMKKVRVFDNNREVTPLTSPTTILRDLIKREGLLEILGSLHNLCKSKNEHDDVVEYLSKAYDTYEKCLNDISDCNALQKVIDFYQNNLPIWFNLIGEWELKYMWRSNILQCSNTVEIGYTLPTKVVKEYPIPFTVHVKMDNPDDFKITYSINTTGRRYLKSSPHINSHLYLTIGLFITNNKESLYYKSE
jgi:hypothetical protein